MKILIACEESGVVTKEFRNLGHDAWSIDLLPTSGELPQYHIIGDVLNNLSGWDMIIAFPPCTHLATSGARWFPEKRADGRQESAINLFLALANASSPKIAVENPVGIMSTIWRKPDQIIQPYEYGHPHRKKTCLWLKGLPLLKPTDIVEQGELFVYPNGKKYPRWLYDAPTKNRSIYRSKTFTGIAKAMANQWGT